VHAHFTPSGGHYAPFHPPHDFPMRQHQGQHLYVGGDAFDFTSMQTFVSKGDHLALGQASNCHFMPHDLPLPSLPLSPGLNAWENSGPSECEEEENLTYHQHHQVPTARPWDEESNAAAQWLGSFLPARSARFEQELRARIEERCSKCWQPANPERGHGHRSITLPKQGRKDPLVLEAARVAGIAEVCFVFFLFLLLFAVFCRVVFARRLLCAWSVDWVWC